MAKPPVAFREGLADLDADRLADFLEELWSARGYAVERDGHILTIRDRHGETRTLAVSSVAPGGEVGGTLVRAGTDGPVDGVVVPVDPESIAVPAGQRVVGPAALYEQVTYALDRPASDRLLRDYVDPSLVGSPAPRTWRASADPSGETDDDRPAGETRELSARSQPREPPVPGDSGPIHSAVSRRDVLVAGGGLLAGVGTGVSTLSGGSSRADRRSEPARAEPPDTPHDSTVGVVVPGVSAAGVTAPATVAAGHVSALRDGSYELSVTKTAHRAGGPLVSSFSLAAKLTATRKFLVRLAARGPDAPSILGQPPLEATVWSDGDRVRRRTSTAAGSAVGEYVHDRPVPEWYYWTHVAPFRGLTRAAVDFYRMLFRAVPTTLASDSTREGRSYPLRNTVSALETPPPIFGRLDPERPVTALQLLAGISRRRIVRTLHLGYRGFDADGSIDVDWTIEYGGIRETTVERPAWVPPASSN